MKTGYAVSERPAAGEFTDVQIAIVCTRWNVEIVDALMDGAFRCLDDWGVPEDAVDEFYAPGAYELPLAASALMETGDYHGVIVLGAVIRGDTPHFDFVAGECARGIMNVQLQYRLPIGFGVLTVNDAQQAVDRAGPDESNKGYEAAAAVLEMIRLTRSVA
ncbi:MAG TPA: 6,7-dimethyl-8-ribityllumazine synthase [Stenotrophobium sp.]|jgi:6,7-dimethyl-8-ribityllumazine synthase|nr:6,7-dimethyl-8-ribityllumazine synthase [Stenotrophobium sp.]